VRPEHHKNRQKRKQNKKSSFTMRENLAGQKMNKKRKKINQQADTKEEDLSKQKVHRKILILCHHSEIVIKSIIDNKNGKQKKKKEIITNRKIFGFKINQQKQNKARKAA
jgi:hypothetical protein